MITVPAMRLPLLATLCLTAGCTAPAQQAAAPAVASAEADPRVDRLFAQIGEGEPGCAVGAARDGETLFVTAYGLADLATGETLAPDTVFRAASVSKMFTAASVLLLAQEGALSLDDDVRDHVPELPDYGAPVPIRRLLNHTGGLPEYEALYRDGTLDYNSATRADQLAAIASLPQLVAPPGEEYSYTNTDYLLLALIVERVSGMSLEDFAQARIFGPLGMEDTAFRGGIGRVPGDATPYHREGGGPFEASPAAAHVGPTGLQTTVTDLLTWGENLATGTVGGAMLAQMMGTQGTLNDGAPVGYGYGMFLQDMNGRTLMHHPGGTYGVHTMFAWLPDTRTTVAVLCNRDDLDQVGQGVVLARMFGG